MIRDAYEGKAHWVLIRFPDSAQLAEWLEDFPNSAMTGQDMSDFSIVKDWETQCILHPTRRIRIWSLDQHLQSYDREP